MLKNFPTIPKIITEEDLVLQKYICYGLNKSNIKYGSVTNELYLYHLKEDNTFTIYNNISDIETAKNLKDKIIKFWNTDLFKNPYVDDFNGNYEWFKRLYDREGFNVVLKSQFLLDNEDEFLGFMKCYYNAVKTAIFTTIKNTLPISSIIIYERKKIEDIVNQILDN